MNYYKRTDGLAAILALIPAVGSVMLIYSWNTDRTLAVAVIGIGVLLIATLMLFRWMRSTKP